MNKRPTTLLEFQKRYSTEDACLRAIEKMRWPKGYICPICNHGVGYRLTTRRLIECAKCKHQSSIIAGTIFHKTRIPLLNWFWMIFLVARDKGGASALRLAKQLGMHYDTVWHILHKIRLAMSKRDKEAVQLAGLIEMDEGFFGGKKRKTQVLVMIEREGKKSGNLVMQKIFGSFASEPGVKKVVEARVDNTFRQHFVTDAANAHNVVRKLGHTLEMHKSTPETAAKYLPLVHMAISLAKRFILGTYHGVSRKHLQQYLDEFCFRYNRRSTDLQLHESLLRACVFADPVCFPELTR
jgi:hypothetical protein